MAELTMTVLEAAEAIGIGKNSMYEIVHTDGFPRFYVGNKIVIPKTSLVKWLEQKAQEEATL